MSNKRARKPHLMTAAAWAFLATANAQYVQEAKLVGLGFNQGAWVALSGDGNTALVNGSGVWTRSGRIWTNQAALSPADPGPVALSADGNLALVSNTVWVRNGATWTQQGPALPFQAWAIALSADGNTALVGGLGDNGSAGAVWVRSGTAWTQQGPKLVGTGAQDPAYQGWSVALSADGNTALVGGPGDNGSVGAVWVWTRTGGTWTQQGPKLVATDTAGFSQQGWSVALSADGNTAIVGGPRDNYQ